MLILLFISRNSSESMEVKLEQARTRCVKYKEDSTFVYFYKNSIFSLLQWTYGFYRTSWDEDDPMPSRNSSWDLPTPRVTSNTQDSLEWSSRRPTPAHKYNAWAKDRKHSGATPLPGKGNVGCFYYRFRSVRYIYVKFLQYSLFAIILV